MPTFIGLGRITDKGSTSIKDWAGRLEETISELPEHVKVRELFFTSGQYDVVIVADVDDAKDVLAISAETAGYGLVRFESMLALTSDEFLSRLK